MEVYGLLASGYGDWPIIKQIAWLLGQVHQQEEQVERFGGTHQLQLALDAMPRLYSVLSSSGQASAEQR